MKRLLCLSLLITALIGCATKASNTGFTSVEGGWNIVIKTDADTSVVDSVYIKPPVGVTISNEYAVEENQSGFENTLVVVKK